METFRYIVSEIKDGKRVDRAEEMPLTPELKEAVDGLKQFWTEQERIGEGCSHAQVIYNGRYAQCRECGAIVQVG